MKLTELNCASSWGELSFEQLVRYHAIKRGMGDEFIDRMQEFEVVSGLEIVGRGVMPMEDVGDGEKTGERSFADEVGKMMEWLEEEMSAGGSCVWMKEKGEGGQEVLVMKKCEFVRVVREVTKWMEEKEGLLKLPEKYMVIGGETFALPMLVGDDERVVRYGQYGDMQAYMVGIMKVMKAMEVLQADGHEQPTEQERRLLEQLRMYKNGFLSCLMLPTVMERVKVDDVSGKDGFRMEERRRVIKYRRGDRERIAEKMEGAPTWLFSMLWHLVQSCLAYYHGRFPDLVSGGKNSSRKQNTDMYVAKLGTDNAVMKYAGYPSVAAVNDEPVGVILERLDAMAKESKEWEKAKRKKG